MIHPHHTTPLPVALQTQIVEPLRAAFPNALGIYAFGSQVQGTAGPHSDWDLAVLVAGYADPLALWDAGHALSRVLHRDVDLLDLRAASSVMQHQILTTGQRLWGKDPEAGLFECFALTEKLRFDESRAALLTDIQTRGSVYGR